MKGMKNNKNFLLFSLVFSLFFLLFSKISFAETIYPYWIEPDTLDVWTKVSIPANGQITLYIFKEFGYIPNGEEVFEFFDDFEGTSLNTDVWEIYSGSSVTVENGYVEIGSANVNNDYNQIRTKTTYTSGKVFIARIYVDNNAFYDVLRPEIDWINSGTHTYVGVTLSDGNENARTENALSGTFSIQTIGSLPEGSWYNVELKWWSDGSSTGIVEGIGQSSVTDVKVTNSLHIALGHHESGSAMKVDYVGVAKLTDPEPSVTIYDRGSYYEVVITEQSGNDLTDYQIRLDGSQLGISSTSESLKISDTPPTENLPPTISIISPTNSTYYGLSQIELKFNVSDSDNSTLIVNAYYDGSQIYSNSNYQSGTITTITQDITQRSHYFKVEASDGITTTTKTVYFYNWFGLNISVYNANNTAISNWNLLAKNESYEVWFNNSNNPTLIEWKDLPQGNVNLTAYASGFDNETKQTTISNSTYENLTFTLYRLQEFKAKDKTSGNLIQNFTLTFFSNNKTYSTTNSKILISLRELQTQNLLGSQLVEYRALGYGPLNKTYDFNLNSEVNDTVELERASLTINTYDEKTYAQIKFNVTISTENSTTDYLDSYTTFYKLWNELPQGELKITIKSNGYIQRNYYVTMTPYAVLSLNAYLLKQSDGIFYTIVVTDYLNNPIPNALITIQTNSIPRKTIEQEKTDSSGKATFFLDPLTTYYVKVEADNYVALTFTLTPDPNLRTTYVRLRATGTEAQKYVNYEYVMDAISYRYSPDNYYLNKSTVISFEISSSKNDLEYFGWKIYKWNLTELVLVYNETIYNQPSGSTLEYTITDYGRYTVQGFFKRANYDLTYLPQKEYYVFNRTGVSSVDLGQYMKDLGISGGVYLLIDLILTMLTIGFFLKVGISPTFATILGIAVFGFILALNSSFSLGGLSNWQVFLIVALGTFSIIFLKSYV